jgi:hypothetical protein
LLQVGGDAQIIFLSQVSHLRVILTLGSFQAQAFTRRVCMLSLQPLPRFLP